MKNIIILGASRAGKSSLSKKIAKKYWNYMVIDTDSVRDAFQRALPKNEINQFGGRGTEEDFPRFIEQLLYWESYNNKDYNYIIDSADISPKKAIELFNFNKNIVLFLGFPNITVEKLLDNCRNYDNENAWSKQLNDAELMPYLKKAVSMSKTIEKECIEHGLKFFDTSFNREKVLDEIVLYIEQNMEK